MYIVNLNEAPLTVLALWHGQHVSFNGVRLVTEVQSDPSLFNDGGLISFTTVDSNPDRGAYEAAITEFFNGTPGVNSAPLYADYYRHLRIGKSAVCTREEFVAGLLAGSVTVA